MAEDDNKKIELNVENEDAAGCLGFGCLIFIIMFIIMFVCIVFGLHL